MLVMKDKTAIIKTAQKYASKGQIDKAIAEWEKLLDEAKDGNIHNTIGDLYLRKGAEREAIESFDKAAEIFRKDGFYPKAIAIYKKILNIAPNNVDALIALARLNAEKGLTGNAIENYYRAAEIYNREGLTEKATMVVEKMLHLSPADVITRSKIAYLYFRIGLRERAANEYASIGATYLEKNDYEKAEEFYNKAMEYDPDNVSALIGLSNLAGKLKNTDKAFRYLETAMSLDPDNKEVLLSYARLAIEFNKTEDAKKALIKLAEADPSDIRARKLLGTLYLDEGLLEIAWEELLPYIDDALNKQKWSEAHELLHKFKDLYPVAAKQRLLHICKAQGDDNAISHELKELAGLYKNEGSNEDALHLYKEALELNPDDSTASDKIKELEIMLGISEPPVETASEEQIAAEDNLIAASGTEEVSIPQEEPAPEMHTVIQRNTMPAEPEPENADIPSQAHTTMSAEEFAAKKAEADFYARQGLENEAIKIYETIISACPGNEEIAQKLRSLKPTDAQTTGISIEKIHEEATASQSGADDDLQALFERFEKSDEGTVDYDAHYTTGLEFKQKGLLDEAIKELRIAAGDQEKKQRNSTMLALCYMEKGSYPLAIAEFNKIIDKMAPSDSTYLHVKYELANAHMNNKDYGRALELFSEVQEYNPDFKDVSGKVDSLKAQVIQTAEERPKPKRDRVSYI